MDITWFEGTELYRERMVRALARDLQVPVLVLDSSILAPYVSVNSISLHPFGLPITCQKKTKKKKKLALSYSKSESEFHIL